MSGYINDDFTIVAIGPDELYPMVEVKWSVARERIATLLEAAYGFRDREDDLAENVLRTMFTQT